MTPSASGTQVKWNRQNPNILASSHSDSVLIWDRRKGSLPVNEIKAHSSKIYGIDWAYNRSSDILTCSLDKTIKIWDTSVNVVDEQQPKPKATVTTGYPVWRARDLPFGDGFLSLPQRGVTTLEMWSHDDPKIPVETFEGHTDVVKEFVWRHGEGTDFQLITWSKDRTLRFWPVDHEKMQRVGYQQVPRTHSGVRHSTTSYRDLPSPVHSAPAISAPVGSRSILAEVRAPLPPRYPRNIVTQPHENSSHRTSIKEETRTDAVAVPPRLRRGGTMSRGNFGGRSVRQPDAFAWLSSVRVGNQRDGSSGPRSGSDSRTASKSRNSSGKRAELEQAVTARVPDNGRESGGVPVQEEITSVLTRLAASKIKLEKHDLMKKRTCTLGLHGPWGESSLMVFIRVTFTFPREYPQPGPAGTPQVDLERNPLISLRSRAFILRRLRNIREHRRPCLEACLRFLLFGQEDTSTDPPHEMHSESSSDDDEDGEQRKTKDITVALLRNHKNLAEPRASQGYFSPSGHLVCFFRDPKRVIDNPVPETTKPTKVVIETTSTVQAPWLVTDAILQLRAISTDNPITRSSSRAPAVADEMGRIITNMLTFTGHANSEDNDCSRSHETPKDQSAFSTVQSIVYIFNTASTNGPDLSVAKKYTFESTSLRSFCQENALSARQVGRYDHQRIFQVVQTLFPPLYDSRLALTATSPTLLSAHQSPVADKILRKLYAKLSSEKDIQMLAMLSILLLKVAGNMNRINHGTSISPFTGVTSPQPSASDYFSMTAPRDSLGNTSASASWRGLSSPFTPIPECEPSVSGSSRSSKASLRISSYRTSGTYINTQDTLKGGSPTIQDTQHPGEYPVPIPNRDSNRWPSISSNTRTTAPEASVDSQKHIFSKSWSESPSLPERKPAALQASAMVRQLQLNIPPTQSRPLASFKAAPPESAATFWSDPTLPRQLYVHILLYAEMLLGWNLYVKRAELLKAVRAEGYDFHEQTAQHDIDVARSCCACGNTIPHEGTACTSCGIYTARPHCSICRLTIKGEYQHPPNYLSFSLINHGRNLPGLH
jgi:hypothetical protein